MFKIRFHVYCNVSYCTVQGIHQYEEQRTPSIGSTDISTVTLGKIYIPKELLLLKTLISYFSQKNYIPSIQKLAFNFPCVRILGAYHRGKERHEEFKCWIKEHDVLCQRDYSELIVFSFSHQIQSE